MDWMTVNGSQAEILAGQHRVAALKLLIGWTSKLRGGSELEKEQSWWICDIYDRGEFRLRSIYEITLIFC